MSVDSWALANHQAVLSHHSILGLYLVVPEDLSVLVLQAGVAKLLPLDPVPGQCEAVTTPDEEQGTVEKLSHLDKVQPLLKLQS